MVNSRHSFRLTGLYLPNDNEPKDREPVSIDRVTDRIDKSSADKPTKDVVDHIADKVFGEDAAERLRENRREMDKLYPDPKPSPPPEKREPDPHLPD